MYVSAHRDWDGGHAQIVADSMFAATRLRVTSRSDNNPSVALAREGRARSPLRAGITPRSRSDRPTTYHISRGSECAEDSARSRCKVCFLVAASWICQDHNMKHFLVVFLLPMTLAAQNLQQLTE